jgi:threonine synthase
VGEIIGAEVVVPESLQAFMKGEKLSIPMSKDFASFKQYLLTR